MFHIAAFFVFTYLEDFASMREPLHEACTDRGVNSTILLASEGINGTIAGSEDGIDAVLAFLTDDDRLAGLDAKRSTSEEDPLLRLKVRLKKEIVTLGVGEVDTVARTSPHVPPEEWNDLISDPDTIVIDTRNSYEIAIGTFAGAVDPGTRSFREFPAWTDEHPELRGKRLAMFCTGGIRCEKATAYLCEQGFDEVYQLDGGILKYLEVCPNCNTVLGDTDRASSGYREGICCASCHDSLTPKRESRFAERQRQYDLARIQESGVRKRNILRRWTPDS